MYRLIVFLAVVVLLVSCNGKSKTGVTTAIEEEPVEYSSQVQSAIDDFKKFRKGYVPVELPYRMVQKDSSTDGFKLHYDNTTVVFSVKDSLLKSFLYDSNLVNRYNLFFNGDDETRLSDPFMIPLEDSNPKILRFGFRIQRSDFIHILEVYIELKNDNATEDMSLDRFLENATITFISDHNVLI